MQEKHRRVQRSDIDTSTVLLSYIYCTCYRAAGSPENLLSFINPIILEQASG